MFPRGALFSIQFGVWSNDISVSLFSQLRFDRHEMAEMRGSQSQSEATLCAHLRDKNSVRFLELLEQKTWLFKRAACILELLAALLFGKWPQWASTHFAAGVWDVVFCSNSIGTPFGSGLVFSLETENLWWALLVSSPWTRSLKKKQSPPQHCGTSNKREWDVFAARIKLRALCSSRFGVLQMSQALLIVSSHSKRHLDHRRSASFSQVHKFTPNYLFQTPCWSLRESPTLPQKVTCSVTPRLYDRFVAFAATNFVEILVSAKTELSSLSFEREMKSNNQDVQVVTKHGICAIEVKHTVDCSVVI